MAQHDYTIANQTFPNTRTDINNALSAIVSQNSGASAPSTTYAFQFWYDTTNNKLKQRNADNDAWIDLFDVDQTLDTATPSTGAGGGAGGGLVHLETQEATTAVTNIKFGSDVFNTTYDRYYVLGRTIPATDGAKLYFRFLDSAETNLTTADSYRYVRNNASSVNATFGLMVEGTGSVHDAETGILFLADIWLPHVGNQNYQSMVFTRGFRVNQSVDPRDDACVCIFRYDKDTTQPEGINFFFSSGNHERAKISVFGVSEGA